MEPTVSYLFPANRVIRDATSGKYTFIDVFDFLTFSRGLPRISAFVVGGRINHARAGNYSVNVNILRPNGTRLAQETLAADGVMEGELQLAVIFPLLTFEEDGKYSFSIDIDGTPVESSGEFYITVKTA